MSLLDKVPNNVKFKFATVFRSKIAKCVVGAIDIAAGQGVAWGASHWHDLFQYLDVNWHLNQVTIGAFISYGLLQLWNGVAVKYLTDDVKELQIDVNDALEDLGGARVLKEDGGLGKSTKNVINELIKVVQVVVEESNKPQANPLPLPNVVRTPENVVISADKDGNITVDGAKDIVIDTGYQIEDLEVKVEDEPKAPEKVIVFDPTKVKVVVVDPAKRNPAAPKPGNPNRR